MFKLNKRTETNKVDHSIEDELPYQVYRKENSLYLLEISVALETNNVNFLTDN